MSHVFISYSRKNTAYARQLANKLLDEGFNIWIDDRIDYGENWERTIFEAIDNCAAFIVIMTPSSYESVWVQRECHYAEKRGKPPFPLLLEGEEFPRYGLTQYADVRDASLPPADFYQELADHAPRRAERGQEMLEQPALPSTSYGDLTDKPASEISIIDADIIDVTPRKDTIKNRGINTWIVGVGAAVALMVMIGLVLAGGDPEDRTYDEWLELGQEQAWLNGDYSAALASYTNAVELDQDDPQAYYLRGEVYHQMEDTEAARQDLKKALDLGEEDSNLFYLLGLTYMDDEPETALEYFNTALEKDATNTDAYLWRGLLYYEDGDYDEAIKSFEYVLDQNDSVVASYLYLADAYYERGLLDDNDEDLDLALENYKTYAEEEDPENIPDYVNNRIEELST